MLVTLACTIAVPVLPGRSSSGRAYSSARCRRSSGSGSASHDLERLGPGRRAVRRLAADLRHAAHVASWRSLIAVPLSLGVAIFLTEFAPDADPAAGRLRDRAAGRDPERGLRPVGRLRPDAVPERRGLPVPARRRSASCRSSRADLRPVGAVRRRSSWRSWSMPYIMSVSREVLLAVPPSQREAALALGATRWEAVMHGGGAVRAVRHHRRDDPRAGPRARRDDGGDDADRQPARDRRVALRARATPWRPSIANEFAEAATDDPLLRADRTWRWCCSCVTVLVNAGARGC